MKEQEEKIVVAEKSVVEPEKEIKPEIRQYVEVSTYNELKKDYDALKYEFMEFKASILAKENKVEEVKKEEVKDELEDWRI